MNKLIVGPIDTLLLRKNACKITSNAISHCIGDSLSKISFEETPELSTALCSVEKLQTAKDIFRAVQTGVDYYDMIFRCDMVLRVNNLAQIKHIKRVYISCNGIEIDIYLRENDSTDKFVYDVVKGTYALDFGPFGRNGAILIKEAFSTERICIQVDKSSTPKIWDGVTFEWRYCGFGVDDFIGSYFPQMISQNKIYLRSKILHGLLRMESVVKIDDNRALLGNLEGYKTDLTWKEAVQRKNTLFDPKKYKTTDLQCTFYTSTEQQCEEVLENIPCDIQHQPGKLSLQSSVLTGRSIVISFNQKSALEDYLLSKGVTSLNFENSVRGEETAMFAIDNAEFSYALYLYCQLGEKQRKE